LPKLARILLSGIACFVEYGFSYSADLPTRKAETPDYLRICSVYGPGFFYIPGTDTCIRVLTKVEINLEWDEVRGHTDPPFGTNTRGRVDLDARTATDWGLLRTFVQLDARRRTGAYLASDTQLRQGFGIAYGGGVNPKSGFPNYSGVNSFYASSSVQLETTLDVSRAFIQWGGVTAGRVQSFFDFYADDDNYHGMNVSDRVTQALAYTYTFGGGFSASLAAEDGAERSNVVASAGNVAAGNIFPSTFSSSAFTNYAITFPAIINPIYVSNAVFPGAFGSFDTGQRQNVPDVVGVLRLDQSWGSAQLSGAWHHVSLQGSVTNVTIAPSGSPAANSVNGGFGGVKGEGWAILGGVKINLPMTSPGDDLWLEASRAQGVNLYTNSGYTGSQGSGSGYNFGASTLENYDGVLNPAGRLKFTNSWSVAADYLHYWTPTVRQAVFGSYFEESFGKAIRSAVAFAEGAACPSCLGTSILPSGANYNPLSPFYMDGAQWQVGSNLTWSPVRLFDIGVEVIYVRNDDHHKHYDANRGYPFLASGDGQWLTQLRLQRGF
jgi:hypothetical protein